MERNLRRLWIGEGRTSKSIWNRFVCIYFMLIGIHSIEGKTIQCGRSGEELKEQLVTLSDSETMFRYSIIDAPIPLFNYVAELRLIPVTVQNHCFIQWKAKFQTPSERTDELMELVKNQVQRAGIQALEKEIIANAS